MTALILLVCGGLLFFTPLTGLLATWFRWPFLILKAMVRVATKGRNEPTPPGALYLAINETLGTFEYYIRIPRNIGVGLWLVIDLLQSLVLLIKGVFVSPWQPVLDLALILLIYRSQTQWILACLKIAEYLRLNPAMHPKPFFKRFKQLLGPLPITLPHPQTEQTIHPTLADFSHDHRSKQLLRVLFPAAWDTAILAHISLKAMKYVGYDYARQIFDAMASMWGKRILEIVKSSLTITGTEAIRNLKGKIILVLNHKSQMDFILTFFALSECFTGQGRPLRPRFITAKDHFVDNPLIYDLMGIGRLIEAVDMVFIERTKKSRSLGDLQQAATFLVNKDIEIAIFPQGTRAEGNKDRSGKRRDAGYYTTVPPKDIAQDLGHLRKGCAYLAVDTLLEMAKTGQGEELHLVFVGLKGTATIMAKQSFKLQTETAIQFTMGQPLTFHISQVKEAQKPNTAIPETPAEKTYLDLVGSLHAQIDTHLVDCLEIHQSLKSRFLLDMQGSLRQSPNKLAQIEEKIETFSRQSPLVYQILDRIYACHQTQWNTYLSQVGMYLLDSAPLERWINLREQVSLTMLGSVVTKLHGTKVNKSDLASQPVSTK